MPIELEVGLLAERFHVAPSVLLEEEIEFISKVSGGLAALRTLQEVDSAMASHKIEGLSEDTLKLRGLIMEAMKDAS